MIIDFSTFDYSIIYNGYGYGYGYDYDYDYGYDYDILYCGYTITTTTTILYDQTLYYTITHIIILSYTVLQCNMFC